MSRAEGVWHGWCVAWATAVEVNLSESKFFKETISSIWAVSLQFDWEPISPLRQKEPHAGLP
jgi:hypothetical protein